jgi:hypothetical protein
MNQPKQPDQPPQPAKPKDLRVFRLLMTLISLGFAGFGVMAMVTGYYDAYPGKGGVRELHLQGEQAFRMGLGHAILGLFPLGVWARKPRQMVVWMLACMGLGIYLMLTS